MSDAATTLFDRVGSALDRSPHLTGHTLHIEMRPGRIVLRGIVPSYYQKQVAQEVVRRVDGVERVDNQLEVDWTAKQGDLEDAYA